MLIRFTWLTVGATSYCDLSKKKSSTILWDYFLKRNDDKEAQEQAITETATKLRKSYIKSVIESVICKYPKASDLKMGAAFVYIPPICVYSSASPGQKGLQA